MTVRRRHRDTEGIGALKLLSALDPSAAAVEAADDASTIDELAQRIGQGARESLRNPSRLHGLRVEAMFCAVLVALGSFRLLVEEDEGQLFYDDVDGPVKLPDYRAVDADGVQLLIEVKAVAPNPRRLRHSVPAAEYGALLRYGRLTRAQVAIAHYWSAANLWTLVALERMRERDGRYEIELPEALKYNELGRFGDRTIGTVPPLDLQLTVEEIGKRSKPDTANVVIRETQLLAAGQPLTDEVEQRIAFLLFRYGRWEIETPAETDHQGRLTSFTLRAVPPEEARDSVKRQGFAMVGALSSMYSALFNEATLNDDGAVRRLNHQADPGEFGSLIPADYFDRTDRRLQLWVVRQVPAEPDAE